MDVRCEKCGTEYELDEARLKPGGVTVKCTSCGHMFKIRKRSVTGVQPVPLAPPQPERLRTGTKPPPPGPLPGPVRTPSESGKLPATRDDAGGGGDRQWMLRLENGESKSCRELATLQQWIVAGLITRETLISRSGKTWKRLGDIPELASFFGVAEGARAESQSEGRVTNQVAVQKPDVADTTKVETKLDDTKSTIMGLGLLAPAPVAAPAVRATRAQTSPPPNAAESELGRSPTLLADEGLVAAAEASRSIPTIPSRVLRPVTTPPPAPLPSRPSTPPPTRPVTTPPAILASAPERSTGAWANDDVRPLPDMPPGATSGPSAGKLRSGEATGEPRFSGSFRPRQDSGGFANNNVFRIPPGDAADDDGVDTAQPRGSRAGVWIALGALLVMGGAAVAIYMLVLRHPRNVTTPVAALSDAGPPVVAMIDAGGRPLDAAAPAGNLGGLQAARLALLADVATPLRAADAALASATDGPTLALRARIATALAQELNDEAGVTADAAHAADLRQSAKQLVLGAVPLAQRALKASPDDVMTNVAMADVMRLQAKATRDVQRYLDQATKAATTDADKREVAVVAGLLEIRDGKRADASARFASLDGAPGSANSLEQTGDVRPRLQVALLLIADGNKDGAKPLIDGILAKQPGHAAAHAAQAKLGALVATTDPMPPELNGSGAGSSATTAAGSGSGHTPTTDGTSGAENSYDHLLAKADQLAESNCTEAMTYYAQALALRPTSVEALTGEGFCHVDAKQFSSAYSKFRTALGISPRYERALWGMAEAYQQQGLRSQAIDAYKAYLDAYPGSAAAQKQLDRLGADTGGDTDSGSAAGSAATPPPTTMPPPTTTTPPASSGSADSPATDPGPAGNP